MTIQIPKDMRGFAYYRVLPADLNNVDIDYVLPSLYFRIVTEGMDRARPANDAFAISSYTEALATHPDLAVDGKSVDLRLIERLIRTSVARVGAAGKGHTRERLQVIDDSTLLSFKPGFPTEGSLRRRVDELLYRMLRSRFKTAELRKIFENSLGKGLVISGPPEPNGKYDGKSSIDTLTRLAIAYLDGMESTGVRKASRTEYDEILPGFANGFAEDLERFLKAYSTRMPAEALTYHLKAIISINLFVYTVKLASALPELVAHPDELPPAMRDDPAVASPPLLYADFTERKGHPSWDMAVACVQRDLAALDPFIQSVLLLKQLEEYLEDLTDEPVEVLVQKGFGSRVSGPSFLSAMLQLHTHPDYADDIAASARRQIRDIRNFRLTAKSKGNEDDDLVNDPDEIQRITAGAGSHLERVTRLLADAQRSKLQDNISQWFRSVGGLTKPYGLLQGESKGHGRLNWRYQPSNDLLATLVMMAGVDIPEWDDANPRPQPIRLREFLEWLERRFGIIVDRPPDMLNGAEYVAAAQDNRRAMLTRLRQMGIFRDLSDDFTVQRLIPPYADAVRHNDALEEVHA